MNKEQIGDLLNFVGPRFRCEGIDQWVDCDNDDKEYTSQEVVQIYLDQGVDEFDDDKDDESDYEDRENIF